MKGVGKILIAVDLGMAAVVGGMKLYLDSGTGAPDDAPAAPVTRHAAAVIAPASPDAAGWDLSAESWMLIGLGVTVVLCIVIWIALGIYERVRADDDDAAYDAPDDALPEPSPLVDRPLAREPASLFRTAADRSDQPVFGRAARSPERV